MTIEQVHQIGRERKILAGDFRSLIFSRNTIIDSFQAEYNRHIKLTAKKLNSREALLDSLSRSRNMKKIQKEFLDNKERIKSKQAACKEAKTQHKTAFLTYEAELIKSRSDNNKKCTLA